MSERKLGESPAKAIEAQAERDGYAVGRYAADGRIVKKVRDEHKGNQMAEDAFDAGFRKGLKDARNS